MRRFTTILLLVLLIGAVAVPPLYAAFSDAESALPPCCRSRGQHHCAMMDQYLRAKAGGGNPAFTAPPSHCQFYPPGSTRSWAPSFPAILPMSRTACAALQGRSAGQAQALTQYRVSFDRSQQKRGPPAFLLV